MRIVGVLPVGGVGKRLWPLGSSKELAPVGWQKYQGEKRPKAISQYVIERMIEGGVERLFFANHPEKNDIIKYYSSNNFYPQVHFAYIINNFTSMADAILSVLDYCEEDDVVLFGLPDTIWFPSNGYKKLVREIVQGADIALGLFKVSEPEKFDSVLTGEKNKIRKVEQKARHPSSPWVWGIGAFNYKAGVALRRCRENLKSGSEMAFGKALHATCLDKKIESVGVKFESGAYLDVGRYDDFVKAESFLTKHAKR